MDTHGTAEGKAHKAPNYFAVFIVLAVITAIMTAIEILHLDIGNLRNILFIVLSLIKAVLVAMYYMHLKMDSWVYTGLFMMPVFLVLVLVVILLV